MRDLHAFLSAGGADDLSLDKIARYAGLNANSLQKQFRALYGTTVFDFIRQTRLQRARQALERDGLTVGQAALMAGYNSAANFATAYRRCFGISGRLRATGYGEGPEGIQGRRASHRIRPHAGRGILLQRFQGDEYGFGHQGVGNF